MFGPGVSSSNRTASKKVKKSIDLLSKACDVCLAVQPAVRQIVDAGFD